MTGDDFVKFTMPEARTPRTSYTGQSVSPADVKKFYDDVVKGRWPDQQARLQEEIRLHRALHNR